MKSKKITPLINTSFAKNVLNRFPMSITVLSSQDNTNALLTSPYFDPKTDEIHVLFADPTGNADVLGQNIKREIAAFQVFVQIIMAQAVLSCVKNGEKYKLAQVSKATNFVKTVEHEENLQVRMIAGLGLLFDIQSDNEIDEDVIQTAVSLFCIAITLNDSYSGLYYVCDHYRNTRHEKYFKTMIHPLLFLYDDKYKSSTTSKTHEIFFGDIILTATNHSSSSIGISSQYHDVEFLTISVLNNIIGMNDDAHVTTPDDVMAIIQKEATMHIEQLVPIVTIKQQKIRSAALKLKKVVEQALASPSNSPFNILIAVCNLTFTPSNETKINAIMKQIKNNVGNSFNVDEIGRSIDELRELENKANQEKLDFIKTSIKNIQSKTTVPKTPPIQQSSSNINTSEDNELIELIEADLEQLTKSNVELTDSNRQMSAEITMLKHQQLINKPTIDDDLRRILFGKPTLHTIINFICTVYPFIVISDELQAQLAKNSPFTFANKIKVLKTLDLICNTYRNAVLEGKPDSIAKTVLGSGYNPTLTPCVAKSKLLLGKREFTNNGVKKVFTQHVTLGSPHSNNETECCEIYFAVNNSNGNLELGYIGRQLPI